jgi:dienelactone hydrolase
LRNRQVDSHRTLSARLGAAVRYRQRVAHTRTLFAALTRRGPHRVLRGDLAFAGLPGVVYTPEAGLNLPGVGFGHDWLTGVERYASLLEHLASWGIVVAAPNTERGFVPSVLNLAFDLGTALDIAAGVRLGPGKISVHPDKLGVIGHGFGGSAAVFAAAGMRAKPKAVAAIFPAVTKPPAEHPAATLNVPGVVFGAPGDVKTLRSNAVELWHAWDTATLRLVSKSQPGGLAEGRRLTKVFGLPGADRKTQKAVRALLTGYLLYTLGGDKTYREFADPDVQLPNTDPVEHQLHPMTPEEKIVALLKG